MKRPLPDADEGGSKRRLGPRAFAHVDGNWPSQVYVKVDMTTPGLDSLSSFVLKAFCVTLPGGCGGREVSREGVLHLSLSRPFVLRLHQIEGFLDKLCLYLNRLTGEFNSSPLRCMLYPEYYVLHNDARSKSFICLPVDPSGGPAATRLGQMVRCVDDALKDFGQPVYYEFPKFHISLATVYPALPGEGAGQVTSAVRTEPEPPAPCSAIAGLLCYGGDNDSDDDAIGCSRSGDEGCVSGDSPPPVNLSVAEIECKVGNRVYAIPLTGVRKGGTLSWKFVLSTS